MNWFSNSFLGMYADYLETGKTVPSKSKADELRALREQQFEEREGKGDAERSKHPVIR